jgi:hypothetical protein
VKILTENWEIQTQDLQRLKKYWEVVFVSNQWYDFWMYQSYLSTTKDKRYNYDKILLTNDSVLITKPLDKIFKWLDKQKAEYIGINEWYISKSDINSYIKFMKKDNKEYISPYENGKHIESWFLQISWNAKELLRELKESWVPELKEQVIMEYELRWSQIAYKRYTTKVLNKNNKKISICYDKPLYMIDRWQPRVKRNFNNYWYKKQFKPVIERLCAEIYKQNLSHKK